MASLVQCNIYHPIAVNNSFACPFEFPAKSPSVIIRRRRCPKIACKSSDENEEPTLDRRDVLVGLCGAAAAVVGGLGDSSKPALGSPIEAPDLSKCLNAHEHGGVLVDCCLKPYSGKVRNFKLPPRSSPLRVRPAAHLVDADYLAKYKKAVELMRGLPDDHPHNFTQQANVHCSYCDGAYHQIGFPELEIQIHGSWLFFPWHRFYLYFHERILGESVYNFHIIVDFILFLIRFIHRETHRRRDLRASLLNWDSSYGMQMPSIYTETSSSLYDKLRDARHQPPALVDLDFGGTDPGWSYEQQVDHNLKIMYRQVISNGKTPSLFMGLTYRAGDEPHKGAGSLELIPHNTLHIWTGDSTQPNREDMGNFYSAARDPIFFAHHSNIERVWYLWKKLGARHRDFEDKDWLNASFLFYDENADVVRVTVKDCLEMEGLRYTYQDVEIPWLKTRPTPAKKAAAVPWSLGRPSSATVEATKFPVVLNSSVSFTVRRPKKVSMSCRAEKEKEEEVLVVDGVEYDRDCFIKFDVFVNAFERTEMLSPSDSEFAGSFVNVPHKHGKKEKKLRSALRLGITDLLEDIGAEAEEKLLVTIVPRAGKRKASVAGIRIEFSK